MEIKIDGKRLKARALSIARKAVSVQNGAKPFWVWIMAIAMLGSMELIRLIL